jgi:hypothetical protein
VVAEKAVKRHRHFDASWKPSEISGVDEKAVKKHRHLDASWKPSEISRGGRGR